MERMFPCTPRTIPVLENSGENRLHESHNKCRISGALRTGAWLSYEQTASTSLTVFGIGFPRNLCPFSVIRTLSSMRIPPIDI